MEVGRGCTAEGAWSKSGGVHPLNLHGETEGAPQQSPTWEGRPQASGLFFIHAKASWGGALVPLLRFCTSCQPGQPLHHQGRIGNRSLNAMTACHLIMFRCQI